MWEFSGQDPHILEVEDLPELWVCWQHVNISSEFISVCTGKKIRRKKIKMKRGWYLSGWVDQQTAVLHQEYIGMTVASYSLASLASLHRVSGTWSCFISLFVWISITALQISSFVPCLWHFCLFLHHQSPFLCLPGATSWFSQKQVLQCLLFKEKSKMPSLGEVRPRIPFRSSQLGWFFSILAVKFWKCYWSNGISLEGSEKD